MPASSSPRLYPPYDDPDRCNASFFFRLKLLLLLHLMPFPQDSSTSSAHTARKGTRRQSPIAWTVRCRLAGNGHTRECALVNRVEFIDSDADEAVEMWKVPPMFYLYMPI
ncbi:uncharacterized protein PV06_11089 [Exophiala oligosperma]|uniref:Uncharacterized protein n=1 Tax=Exophiala oligosperma TaxID=215243 RepID=A0A0D2A8M1_9EURO|nr:uncharacterized protein PV06_11089 [Exophiala oligosperma]KIW36671.1 hypothetical protein PV06_11089 [Exophiala oligosperma]